jgi:hypothetical protein
MRGRIVFVAEGETVTGMDFALVRGGVMTGRVTTPDGQPAIKAPLFLERVDGEQDSSELDPATASTSYLVPTTDDLGKYRIFALDPGQYIIGAEPRGGRSPQAYYPGVTDKTRATVITVSSGQEIANIDIALTKKPPTYEATGQAVDDAGHPVVGAAFHDETGNGRQVTDESGRFRLQGLQDGPHSVRLSFDQGRNCYGEPVNFTVAGANVTGLRIKVHHGASITGVVALDGDQNPQVLSQLANVHLDTNYFHSPSQGSWLVPLDSEGGFQVTGLSPGTASLSVDRFYSPAGFSVLRIERDGVPQPDGIAIGPGDQITGVRIVLAYGAGVLRGQITFQGGALPPGTFVEVQAVQISEDQSRQTSQSSMADPSRAQIDR